MARRMRVQSTYTSVFEDWLFNVLLPLAAYATLAVSAYVTRSYVEEGLFGVGTAALLLLFIGIHNAWDAVTYHVFVKKPGRHQGGATSFDSPSFKAQKALSHSEAIPPRVNPASGPAGRYLWTAFAAVINAACSPRVNAPSDQLAPDGRLPGTAAPTLDTQGEAR